MQLLSVRLWDGKFRNSIALMTRNNSRHHLSCKENLQYGNQRTQDKDGHMISFTVFNEKFMYSMPSQCAIRYCRGTEKWFLKYIQSFFWIKFDTSLIFQIHDELMRMNANTSKFWKASSNIFVVFVVKVGHLSGVTRALESSRSKFLYRNTR